MGSGRFFTFGSSWTPLNKKRPVVAARGGMELPGVTKDDESDEFSQPLGVYGRLSESPWYVDVVLRGAHPKPIADAGRSAPVTGGSCGI